MAWLPPAVHSKFIEPFAGSAAISLAVAQEGRASRFILSDILEPLAAIWRLILNEPDHLYTEYERLWNEQLENPRVVYDRIRDEFNTTREPSKLLYLITRCVKNAVRFNPRGEFNQSPDNRRLGMRPMKMRREILDAHNLLEGKTTVLSVDYRDVLRDAMSNDVVYMDPPYQGISNGRDRRYVQSLDLNIFVDELKRLNRLHVPYLVSFDGQCGSKSYGKPLPEDLRLKRIDLLAGRSTQATLLGRNDVTTESLYLSQDILEMVSEQRPYENRNMGQQELKI